MKYLLLVVVAAMHSLTAFAGDPGGAVNAGSTSIEGNIRRPNAVIIESPGAIDTAAKNHLTEEFKNVESAILDECRKGSK